MYGRDHARDNRNVVTDSAVLASIATKAPVRFLTIVPIAIIVPVASDFSAVAEVFPCLLSRYIEKYDTFSTFEMLIAPLDGDRLQNYRGSKIALIRSA